MLYTKLKKNSCTTTLKPRVSLTKSLEKLLLLQNIAKKDKIVYGSIIFSNELTHYELKIVKFIQIDFLRY